MPSSPLLPQSPETPIARPASHDSNSLPDEREIAAQLRCPEGPLGVSFGQTMNLRNLSMIIGGLRQLELAAKAISNFDSTDNSIQSSDTDTVASQSQARVTRMLELGCGNGGLLGFILSTEPDLHYWGLEISETMVNEALSFNAPFIQAGIAHYQIYDGRRIPFDDARFDRVLSVNTLYFWDEPVALLAEICRVMKPGGLLCLSFSEKNFMRSLPFAAHDFHHYEMADVQRWIKEADLPLMQRARIEQQDKAVSKSGTLVNRPFVHLLLAKQG